MGVGTVDGVTGGDTFADRKTLSQAGVHRANQAGITGTKETGAESIVLSGGYEDDEDHGDTLVYTGQGGRDLNTGKQIADQEFKRGNAALVTSCLQGLPVRVIRGRSATGYRYDGLYRVDEYWSQLGKSGFQVCRFRLVAETEAIESETSDSKTKRSKTTVLRIVRDSRLTKDIKRIYDFTCQVCGTRLNCEGGPYAEGAHIRPLGKPHNGPDKLENILCLCPNHHVLFDHGGFTIGENLTLDGVPGSLTIDPKHSVGKEYLDYHRMLWRKQKG